MDAVRDPAQLRHRSVEVAMSRKAGAAGFQSVLCPIDFSDTSAVALQYAHEIASRFRAALTVVYVNDPMLIAAAAAALHDRGLARRSGRALRAFVQRAIPSATHARVTTTTATGAPADEILELAVRRRAEVIVLGTQGLTGADRLFIGSTTLSVLQRATIPVLAIPAAGGHRSRPSASWPGTRVIAAIELDEESEKEALAAGEVARWFGASLLLVHVVTQIGAPAWIKGDLSAHDRIRVARAQQALDAVAVRVRSRVDATARVVCGAAADEIAAIAASEQSGLVVTALRDRRGWFGARRGSVSYHVLSHAVTPVLALPPRWRPK